MSDSYSCFHVFPCASFFYRILTFEKPAWVGETATPSPVWRDKQSLQTAQGNQTHSYCHAHLVVVLVASCSQVSPLPIRRCNLYQPGHALNWGLIDGQSSTSLEINLCSYTLQMQMKKVGRLKREKDGNHGWYLWDFVLPPNLFFKITIFIRKLLSNARLSTPLSPPCQSNKSIVPVWHPPLCKSQMSYGSWQASSMGQVDDEISLYLIPACFGLRLEKQLASGIAGYRWRT